MFKDSSVHYGICIHLYHHHQIKMQSISNTTVDSPGPLPSLNG